MYEHWIISYVYNILNGCTNYFNCFCSSFALTAVVIDPYPPVTTVEQGESIVLVCRVVGVLPSVTLSYGWSCGGWACTGTEEVSGNRLKIDVLNGGNLQGTFTCSVTGSGVSVSGAFSLTVNSKTSTFNSVPIRSKCVGI